MQTKNKAIEKKVVDQPLDCPRSFAKYTNVTAQTVRNWVHRGIIPTVIHNGKIIRFNRAEALAALAGERGAA